MVRPCAPGTVFSLPHCGCIEDTEKAAGRTYFRDLFVELCTNDTRGVSTYDTQHFITITSAKKIMNMIIIRQLIVAKYYYS